MPLRGIPGATDGEELRLENLWIAQDLLGVFGAKDKGQPLPILIECGDLSVIPVKTLHAQERVMHEVEQSPGGDGQ
jgi:hypothetical protein